MSFEDPLVDPHADPNRDLPPWPTTPHSPTSPHPTLVKSSSPLPTPALDAPSSGPWGKEPQIYGKPEPGLISPRTATSSNGTNFEKPEPYLRVRITALDRNRRDILIRFDAQTNLSNFTGTTYRNVSRTYAEFQRFYEQAVHSNPQTIIPALPPPQTSAPTDEEGRVLALFAPPDAELYAQDDRLMRVMLQRWFTRVCEDPILLADEELRSFVESDFGYQPMPRIRRRVGSTFGLLSRRPPDEDEELARARFELTRLETQYLEAAKAVEKLSRARKAISVAHADMGNKLIDVAANEVHPPLADAVRRMGRGWHNYADLDQAQGMSDSVILGDSLAYQSMNARSAKETLLQRSAVLEEYQEAVKNTINKRRNIERLKASSNIRPERVDDALEDLEEANKVEQHLHRRVEGISVNLHRALQTHSRLAHEDLTAALIEHARANIMYERQLLRELESLVPAIKVASNPVAAKPVAPTISRIGQAVPPSVLQRGVGTMPANYQASRPPMNASTFDQPAPSPANGQDLPPATPPKPPALLPPPISVNGAPAHASPRLPSAVPSFPKTNQFASAGSGPSSRVASPAPPTPTAPGFPKTSQFVTPSLSRPTTSSFSAFPKTNQFVNNGTPIQRTGTPIADQAHSPARPGGTNGHAVLPPTPQTPRAHVIPPSQAQPQAQPHVDPLAGSRIISSQPVHHLSSSMAGLPPSSSGADPLTGSYYSQASSNADPLMGSTLSQSGMLNQSLSGTLRAPSGHLRSATTPNRSRLDAREAASKLANFL